ncbi:hypothetical protein ACFU0X_19725 [Streptomyces cellulosae]|uniref:Uncharacterized protein n=1 Tax=Streptomyces cellulosae TaxID=1968 RepID=A0ABW6JIM9_STRCE
MSDTTTPPTGPVVRISELEVCALPADHEAYPAYVLRIRQLAGGWAVIRPGDRCLGRDGTWSYGSQQGDRDDAWLADHRFGIAEAVERAQEAARLLTVRGCTAGERLAEEDGAADVAGEAAQAAAELAQAWAAARHATPDHAVHNSDTPCT